MVLVSCNVLNIVSIITKNSFWAGGHHGYLPVAFTTESLVQTGCSQFWPL